MNTILLLATFIAAPGVLLSPEQAMDLDNALFVDGRPYADYTVGHIPGAAHVDYRDLAEDRDGAKGLLKPVANVRKLLGDAGVDPNRRVVVYADTINPDSIYPTTRLFWILEYMGYPNVSVLDGGLDAWVDAGGEVETGEPDAAPADLGGLKPEPNRLAVVGDVETMLESGEGTLIDSRNEAYFTGEKKSDSVSSAGRIDGAVLIGMATLCSGEDGKFPEEKALRKLVEKGGVSNPAEPVITYCNTGRSASVSYFVLRSLGYENVRMYDGSLSEWTALGKPVVTGPEE